MAQPINPNQQSRGEQAAWRGLFSDDPAIKADANLRYMIAIRFRQGGLELSSDEIDAWVVYHDSEVAQRGSSLGYQATASAVQSASDRGVVITPPEEIAIAREAAMREAQAIQAAINAREAAAAAQVQAEAEAFERLKAVDNAAAFALMQQRYIESQAAAAQKAAEDAAYQARYEELQAQASLEMQQRDALEAYKTQVRADVADLYRQILFREPSYSEAESWVELVVSGSIIFEYIAPRLSQSDEAMIVGAYQQYLNRLPSAIERGNWLSSIAQGLISANAAVDAIRNSEEAWSYADSIVPTPGTSELIVQTINPASGSAQAIDPIMGTSTWGTSYTNQDMIAADPVASPVIDLQNYYNPDVNISDLEPVSPLGDTSPTLAFKAREEIYKTYTASLRREPSEADYQYWEPLLVSKSVSLVDFKRFVDESDEARAIKSRSQAVTLDQTQAPATVAPTEGIGAAFGVISAIAFFLGQS